MSGRARILAAFIILVVLFPVISTPASADADVIRMELPMQSASVVSVTPAAEGGATLLLSDGFKIDLTQSAYSAYIQGRRSLLRQQAGGGVAQPQDVVYGNCGSSWVTWTRRGSYSYRMNTGYALTPYPSVSHWWSVSYTGNFSQRPATNPVTWSANFSTPRQGWTSYEDFRGSGTAYAAVSQTSWALTTNGSVCHSGGPVATVNMVG